MAIVVPVTLDPRTRLGLRTIERDFNRVERRGVQASRVITTAFAAIGTGVAIRGLQRYADEFTNITNQLRTVTDNTEQLTQATDALFASSNRTRQSFGDTATFYQRVAVSARELGFSQERLLRFSEGVQQAIVLSGASAQTASGALLQLSQAIGANVLRAEEFNSIIEGAPVIIQTLARHLGVATGEVRALSAAGEITATTIIEAFEAAEEDLAQRFGETVPTIAQSFVVLSNNVTRFVGTLDSATGTSTAISTIIIALANNLDNVGIALAGVATLFGVRLAGSLIRTIAIGSQYTRQLITQIALQRQLAASAGFSSAQLAGLNITAAASNSRFNALGRLLSSRGIFGRGILSATTTAGSLAGVLGRFAPLFLGPAGIAASIGLSALSLIQFANNAEAAEGSADGLEESGEVLNTTLNSVADSAARTGAEIQNSQGIFSSFGAFITGVFGEANQEVNDFNEVIEGLNSETEENLNTNASLWERWAERFRESFLTVENVLPVFDEVEDALERQDQELQDRLNQSAASFGAQQAAQRGDRAGLQGAVPLIGPTATEEQIRLGIGATRDRVAFNEGTIPQAPDREFAPLPEGPEISGQQLQDALIRQQERLLSQDIPEGTRQQVADRLLQQADREDPFRTLTESASRFATEINEGGLSAIDNISGALGEFARTGNLEIRDLTRNILGSFAEIAANNVLRNLFGGLFGENPGSNPTAGLGGLLAGLGGGGSGGGGGLGSLFGLATSFLGFNQGGSFITRGRGGIDNNLTLLRTSDRERVDITPDGAGGNMRPITIVNQDDPERILGVLEGDLGAETIVNVLRKVAPEARAVLRI